MATIPLSQVLTDDLTSFKTVTGYLTDYANRPQLHSIFGDTISANRIDSVSASFHYNISDRVVTTAVNGTGAVSHLGTDAVISTGTGIGDGAITSIESIRHHPGHETHVIFDAVFSAPLADATMKIGALNGDGFWFGYNGLDFGVGYRKGGVDTFVPSSSWNGTALPGLDPSMRNLYKITYAFGAAPVKFEVSTSGPNEWTVVHTMDIRNTDTENLVDNFYIPVTAVVDKTAASPATAVSISTSAWSAGSAVGTGDFSASDQYLSFSSGTKAIAANTPTNIISVRNPVTWQGKTNHVRSQLLSIGISTEGTKPVNFEFLRGATVSGSPVFTPILPNSSPLEYDLAGTNVTGGTLSWGIPISKASQSNFNTATLNLILPPGQTTTLSATSTATSDVSVYLRVRDIF